MSRQANGTEKFDPRRLSAEAEEDLRSDHQSGTSYGRKGRTPVVAGTGKRFRVNMTSTLTDQGQLAFMLFEKTFTGGVMIDFLRRLRRHAGRKVFLIVDRHPVHRSKMIRRWVERHHERVHLFFCPTTARN